MMSIELPEPTYLLQLLRSMQVTRSSKIFEASAVSVNASGTYTPINLSGTGLLHELLIVSPQNTFRVNVAVDSATIWSKSYSDASSLTDVIPTMSAFQDENGNYIYFLSLLPFRSSLQVNVENLNTSSSITLNYVYAKYEVA
jgi:hypothetical protein